jgi:signal peptidase I
MHDSRSPLRILWNDWTKPVLVVAIVLGSFRSAIADWNDVPSGSMRPTILEGDRIVVDKLAYDLRVPFVGTRIARLGEPQRGEIATLVSPVDGKRLVKRIVALPGDRIELRGGVLVVNGTAATYEPMAVAEWGGMLWKESLSGRDHGVEVSLRPLAPRNFGPVTVPSESLFVMGDNRDGSFDSRAFGFVPRDSLRGRARAIAFSIDHDRWRPRGDRFFRPLG